MARGGPDQQDKAAMFFMATLIMWAVSVFFEILFNRRTELIYILAGFFFFQSANWFIRYGISRDPLFVNTCVSLLHSSITSILVIFVLVNRSLTRKDEDPYEMFEHSQLVGAIWPWAYQALCFSCGYFAYDQLDMLRYRLYSGYIPSILSHHLVLLVCFTLALFRNVTINYLILTLVCELHSVFLHVRKLRRMVGIRDAQSIIIKVEWVLNWFTFIFARLVPHVLITMKLVKDASEFEKGVELPLALFGMAGMNLLNVLLGLDLFKAFLREINLTRSHQNHRD
ncbi:TLC domain-containing protein 2 [Impatiens glandulifera]|uniref:TLC domain-containing protein 2 n=1 Tax=Impatiens glandulifera TaxID=253017 RepID=UPI001FB06EDC|nr:TLC domain-containing protein 2 [Impatiens glandulifera]